MKIILASTSPRRIDLFKKVGLEFEVKSPDFEEDNSAHSDPFTLTKKFSYEKAMSVAKLNPDKVVIGADTIVVCQNEILGKPKDKEDARRMLNLLSNGVNSVVTGYTIVRLRTNQVVTKAVETKVYFKKLTREEIDDYIATGEPLGKAGSYEIQGYASKFIARIEGDYDNVVGLPMKALVEDLKKFE